MPLLIAATVLVAGLAGCSAPEPDRDAGGGWVGTTTTAEGVTTVVNEAGSVWGSDRLLVEEASIGVDQGADEYMLGMVTALTATDDRIYVIDMQVPAVREYDHEGRFIANLGRAGEGPGEYQQPAMIAALDDHIFVVDASGGVEVFAAGGEAIGSWSFSSARCCVWPVYALDSQTLWAPVEEWLDDTFEERRFGVQAVGPDGPFGDTTWIPELEYEQTMFTVREGFDQPTPFSPWITWNPTPSGGLVVGTSDRYRFEVHAPDGSVRAVERYWEPEPVPAEHRDYERRKTMAFHRRSNRVELVWDGAEMPRHKPAYMSLVPSASGEIWVFRPGPSVRQTDCIEDPMTAEPRELAERPCWKDAMSADVFDTDGRYLGAVELPDLPWAGATNFAIDGDRVVTSLMDERGVVQVKRYRLQARAAGTN